MYYFIAPQGEYVFGLNPQFLMVAPPSLYFQSPSYQAENQKILPKIPPFHSENQCEDENADISLKTQEKSMNSKNTNLNYHRIQKKARPSHKKKDEEFTLTIESSKKRLCTYQSQNRNVVPNILHQMISFVFKKNRSGVCVSKLLSKHGMEGDSSKRFYGYLSLIREKINNYVNSDVLNLFTQHQDPDCFIYSEQEQQLYLKISRILIKYFFTHDFQTINLTSVKMRSDKRKDHLRARRTLLKKFNE